MRDLTDYGWREWALGAPLSQRARRLRNLAIDALYARFRPPGLDVLVADLRRCRPRVLAVTIAFNLPDAIALLHEGMTRFVPGATLLVCDNSSDPQARAAIADLCRQRGIFYCPLPAAPRLHSRPNGSRSHAVAINWVWRTLIRPVAPAVFALLDHDLVPLCPDDLAARVADQPVYGMVRQGTRGPHWYLWPGYSVFDFAAVARLPLDFGTDTPLTLDTGGQNWSVLYQHLDLSALAQASIRQVYLADPQTGEVEPHLLADGWLHVGGAGHRGAGREALKRVRAAYEADPDALLPRLLASAVPGASAA